MRIFVTGASGLVGAAVTRAAARRGHHVLGVVGKFSGELEGVERALTLDLASTPAATAAVLEFFPDAIVNCAAISEPAACDADPARSELLNVTLPRALAEAAQHLNARYVHISSEQVFDGETVVPYVTGSAVSPINLYGRQKVASELGVLAAAPACSAIVRAPLLMGDSPGGRRGLHERLLGDWVAGRTARLYTDEFRQPCTAESLAEVLLELAERPDLTGVFHWAGAELLSRYELGLKLRAHFRLDERVAPITAVTRASTPEAAKQRQPCLALDLSPLLGKLKTQPETVVQQLASLRIPRPCRDWYLAQA